MSDYANRERDVREFYCRADVWRLSQPYQLLSDTEQIFSDRMAGKAHGLKDFDLIQAEFTQSAGVEPIPSALGIVRVHDGDMILYRKLDEGPVGPIRGIQIGLCGDIVGSPTGEQCDASCETRRMQHDIDGIAFGRRHFADRGACGVSPFEALLPRVGLY